MLGFNPRYKDFAPKPTLYLFGISRLQEQFDRFAKVGSGFFDRRALTSDVKLRAERRAEVSVLFDDGGVHRRRVALAPWLCFSSRRSAPHTKVVGKIAQATPKPVPPRYCAGRGRTRQAFEWCAEMRSNRRYRDFSPPRLITTCGVLHQPGLCPIMLFYVVVIAGGSGPGCREEH